MTSGRVVRSLEATERDDLLRLYRHLHASDVPASDEAHVEASWQSLLANPGVSCFGAFVDGQLIASCVLIVVPNLTRGCRPFAVVENVVTHPEFRRRGHGRAVLIYALDSAWQAGCYKVMLMTGRKDDGTYAFYESAGFDRHAKQAFVARPG